MNLNDNDNDDDVSQLRLRFLDLAKEPRKMLPPIQGFEKMPLVSLEMAVKPLVEKIPDLENKASLAKKNCKLPPADGLSIDESASIMLYTMGGISDRSFYVILNQNLRSEDRTRLKDWFLYLKLFITALRKIPSKPYRLFRGVKLDLSEKHPKGQKTIWWAFSSCTDSLEVLEKPLFLGKTGIRTLFEIDCYSAKDIRQHSRYPVENELILLPATLFQITECFDPGHDLHIIHLKEIKPEFPLIDEGPISDASSIPVSPVKPVKNEPRPKPKLPGPMSKPVPDPTYRNRDLESAIARFQPQSRMNFDGKQLTDKDIKIVIDQGIIDRRCKALSLPNNEMTSQGILLLADGVRESTTLEELDLSNNRLSDDDLIPLARELSVNRPTSVEQWKCCGIARMKKLETAPIKTLNLSNNNIGDEGTKYLAEVLKVKQTLVQLNLSSNRISDKGVQLLANALSRPTANLLKLYLHNNRLINDSSVDYLVDMLKQNRSLNTLWLINCNLTNVGRKRLKEAVASRNGFQLIVEPCD